MIVVFEGYDGTGKTTLVDAIAKKLSYDYKVNTHTFNNRPMQKYKEKFENTDTRLLIDVAACKEQDTILEELVGNVPNGEITLVDRWLMSAFAYLEADKDLLEEYLPIYNKLLDHFQEPDLIILMKSHTTEPNEHEKLVTEAYGTLIDYRHLDHTHTFVNNTSVIYNADNIASLIRKEHARIYGRSFRKES